MTGGLPPEQSATMPAGGLQSPQSQQSQIPPVDGGLPDVGVQGQGQGYNGRVSAFGQQINVVDGIAKFGEEQFLVSRNGEMVVNSDRKVIGHIRNNEFIEADDAYIEQLRSQGMIEEGT